MLSADVIDPHQQEKIIFLVHVIFVKWYLLVWKHYK